MPTAPDADENITDQPGMDPETQPGVATSSDEAPKEPDAGEAEASADRDAAEADQAATDTGEGETAGEGEGESFPPPCAGADSSAPSCSQ